MSTLKNKSKKGTILRVSAYLFRYKGLFWLTIGLAAGMTAMEIAVPLAIERILENIENAGAVDSLLWGVGIIAGLYMGSEIFNSLRIRVNNTLEQKVLLEMRRDLHTKLLRLPVSFYDRRKSGEISSRVIDDVAALERALLDGTEQGTGAVLKIVGITTFLTPTFFSVVRFFTCSRFAHRRQVLLTKVAQSMEGCSRKRGRFKQPTS